jgi:hypothetical protein
MAHFDTVRLESLRTVILGQVEMTSIDDIKESMIALVNMINYNDLWRLMMGELMVFVASDLPEFNVMLIQIDVMDNKADVDMCIVNSHKNAGNCRLYWQNLDLVKRVYETYEKHYAHMQPAGTITESA